MRAKPCQLGPGSVSPVSRDGSAAGTESGLLEDWKGAQRVWATAQRTRRGTARYEAAD